MSQHTFSTTSATGEPVNVSIGFDPRLGECFYNCFIDHEVTASSLGEAEPKDWDTILRNLAKSLVAVPAELISTLAMEILLGGSNEAKDWGDYPLSNVERALLELGFFQAMISKPQSIWLIEPKDVDLGAYRCLQTATHHVHLPLSFLKDTDAESPVFIPITEDDLIALLTGAEFVAKVNAATQMAAG